MWILSFWKETAERGVKTAAQAIILGLSLGEGLNAFDVDWQLALGFALGGLLLSVLFSIVSAPLGVKGTASVIK